MSKKIFSIFIVLIVALSYFIFTDNHKENDSIVLETVKIKDITYRKKQVDNDLKITYKKNHVTEINIDINKISNYLKTSKDRKLPNLINKKKLVNIYSIKEDGIIYQIFTKKDTPNNTDLLVNSMEEGGNIPDIYTTNSFLPEAVVISLPSGKELYATLPLDAIHNGVDVLINDKIVRVNPSRIKKIEKEYLPY